MRRIVHVSDLHFGRDTPELVGPLIASVNALRPDLVAISGDLTQRATATQFRAAAAFIAALRAPVLTVPGNHDVPLHNLALRLSMPWRRWRRWIGRDLEPQFHDDEIAVVGVNTVNPLAWQQGHFPDRAIRRVCAAFGGPKAGRTYIVVAHHPLEHRPGERKALIRNAARAVQGLSDCGVDVVLSGHLHSWGADPFILVEGRRSALQVQAGTGLSDRLRGEANDFNLLEVEGPTIAVRRHSFDPARGTFTQIGPVTFAETPAGWLPKPPEAGGVGAASGG